MPSKDVESNIEYIPDILQMMGTGPNLKMTIPRQFQGQTLTVFGDLRLSRARVPSSRSGFWSREPPASFSRARLKNGWFLG